MTAPRAWPEEDEKRVVELVNAHVPASKIAIEFGVSRNAILGLVDRIKKRPANANRDESAPLLWAPRKLKAPRKSKVVRAKRKTDARIPSPEQSPVELLERQQLQCAWPLWDDDTPARDVDPAMVCGAPVFRSAGFCSPYCEHHHKIAYET